MKLFLKGFVLQVGTSKLRFDHKGRAQFLLGRRLCSAWSLLETMSLKSCSVNVPARDSHTWPDGDARRNF